MRELVTLYVLRYGLTETLTQIAGGLAAAAVDPCVDIHGWTDDGKKGFREASTEIYRIKNDLYLKGLCS